MNMASKACNPRFFRSLMPGFQERLEIPRLFLKHIIHEKYESATILSLLGKSWHVEVHEDITRLYFEEGWQEVVQAHDLRVGYFLIFSYQGGMVFTMTVFDLSFCTKHYTSLLDAGDDHQAITTTGKVRAEEQNPEVIAVRKSTVEKKRTRREEDNRNPEKGTPATWRITMRARNLVGHYYLYIPVAFKEVTGISNSHQVMLRDPNGRLWKIRVQHTTKNRTHLVEGWREFCISNELKTGDECEFKLLPDSNSKQIVQVNIYKNLSRKPPSTIIIKTSGTSINPDGKPWFWITLTPFALGHYQLQVPNRFTSVSKISEMHEVILRDEEDRLFTVPLLHTTRGRTILTNWRSFSDANDLKLGDNLEFRPVIHFEKKKIFQVRIVRK